MLMHRKNEDTTSMEPLRDFSRRAGLDDFDFLAKTSR
ncbi:hypothetical protein SLEP1_g18041 [Rubroshorea leprosula]|uniref:Uncharacterized protein n=1 Tax=Rubroshorea leprosula TaxID=152421 RepID=A0AAV5IW60_9ROSI|nr:hypothetical protein SLEP1_g18041 [Rubroshorea leprosula]